jgi:hypothetical protein
MQRRREASQFRPPFRPLDDGHLFWTDAGRKAENPTQGCTGCNETSRVLGKDKSFGTLPFASAEQGTIRRIGCRGKWNGPVFDGDLRHQVEACRFYRRCWDIVYVGPAKVPANRPHSERARLAQAREQARGHSLVSRPLLAVNEWCKRSASGMGGADERLAYAGKRRPRPCYCLGHNARP